MRKTELKKKDNKEINETCMNIKKCQKEGLRIS